MVVGEEGKNDTISSMQYAVSFVSSIYNAANVSNLSIKKFTFYFKQQKYQTNELKWIQNYLKLSIN